MPHETQGLFLYDYVLLCYFPFEQLSAYVCPTLYTGIHPIGPVSLENLDEYTHLSGPGHILHESRNFELSLLDTLGPRYIFIE